MSKAVHHQPRANPRTTTSVCPSREAHQQFGEVTRDRKTATAPVPPPMSTGWRRALQLTLAGFCFALGVLGAVLPGLPTTPFLLLTSGLLLRSSPRLNARLLRSRFFGPILQDWQVHRGVRADVKVKAVCGVLIAIIATVYFTEPTGWTLLVLLAAASIGITVIARLPAADRPSASVHEER